jgi:hypothetical protein
MTEFKRIAPDRIARWKDDDKSIEISEAEFDMDDFLDHLLKRIEIERRQMGLSVEQFVSGLREFLTVENVQAWIAEQRAAVEQVRQTGERLQQEREAEKLRRHIERFPNGAVAARERAKAEQRAEGMLP